jgi:hypothetical protein
MTGEEMGALTNVLCAAFDLAAFEIMLRTRLNRRLDTVAGDGPLRVAAFKTVDVACREGWDRRLISAALAANPGNPELLRFCRDHPHLVDSPPPPPEDAGPVPEKEPVHSWFGRRWPIVAGIVLVLAGAAIWGIDRWTDRRRENQDGQDSSREKRGGEGGSSGSSSEPRLRGPLRLTEGSKDVERVVRAFRDLSAQGVIGPETKQLALWIIGPPAHEDLEAVQELARSLRPGRARVVAAGAEDNRLEGVLKTSGFKGLNTSDGRKILDDKTIDAVVFIGLFRSSILTVKPSKRTQVTPVVDTCRAGKDCFIVISTEDKVRWQKYLGKRAPAESRQAMDEAAQAKRMLYASILVEGGYKEDFTSFFRAIRERNPKLRGAVELLE